MPGVPNSRPPPAPPKLNTNFDARGDDRRPPRNSPLSLRQTRTPVPSEMQAHNLKRPHPDRSRGNSPPEKKGRTGPPSPPRSRTSSGFGLPNNARTGPGSNHSPHAQSPASRSGASTPVQNAPRAPSMLPKPASVGISDKPISLSSLQGLKYRKQAVQNASKPQSDDAATISSLANELKIKVAENVQLNESLKKMEEQIKAMQTRLDHLPNDSELTKGATVKNAVKLDDITSRLAKLESASANAGINSASLKDVKKNLENLEQWKSTQSDREEKIVKDIKIFVQQEVDSKLMAHRKVLQNELHSGLAESQKVVRQEIVTAEKRTAEKNSENMKTLTSLFNILDAFKKDVDKQNIPKQLNNIFNKIETVADKEHHTYKRLCRHIEDVEKFIGPVKGGSQDDDNTTTVVDQLKSLGSVVEQVKTFQGALAKLDGEQKILKGNHDTFELEKKALQQRVTLLGKNVVSLDKKIKGPVAGPSTNASPVQDTATKTALKTLGDDMQVLQSSLAEVDSLRKQVATFKQKIDSIDLQSKKSVTEDGVSSAMPPSRNELATIRSQVTNFDSDMQSLEEQLTTLEETSYKQGSMIKALGEQVPEIFARNMEPFKETVMGRFEQINQSLQGLKKDVVQLQTTTAEQLSLQEQHGEEIATIKSTPNDSVASLKLAFRGLQDQYNNITTDGVYANMVQWFLENYPANAANMVQQFGALRKEVQNLQSSVQENTVLLKAKTTNADVSIVNDAGVKEMKAAIEGVQKSLHSLNSANPPFAPMGTFGKLSKQVMELDARTKLLETELRRDVAAIRNDFMEPNRENLGSLGYLIELVKAIESAIQVICENAATKNGQTLEIEWPTLDDRPLTQGHKK